jgi:hypothetical protein
MSNFPLLFSFINLKSSGLEKDLSKYQVFYPHNIPYSNDPMYVSKADLGWAKIFL